MLLDPVPVDTARRWGRRGRTSRSAAPPFHGWEGHGGEATGLEMLLDGLMYAPTLTTTANEAVRAAMEEAGREVLDPVPLAAEAAVGATWADKA